MCGGASQEQKDLSKQQTAFYQQLQQENSQQFANQQGVLKQLTDVYSPILQAGPNQQGFSGEELTAMNTAAEEGVANNYQSAQKAVQNQIAARGGGDQYVPTGATAALSGQIASSAAGQLASEKNQITQANYATGRQNFQNAANALAGVAGQNNSTGTANAATSAGAAAGNTLQQINQENNAWMGALGGLAGGVIDGGLGLLRSSAPTLQTSSPTINAAIPEAAPQPISLPRLY